MDAGSEIAGKVEPGRWCSRWSSGSVGDMNCATRFHAPAPTVSRARLRAFSAAVTIPAPPSVEGKFE
jgi:hypothetical protein